MPANLVPETDPKFWDDFNTGFAAAKARLAKPSCAKYLVAKGADALGRHTIPLRDSAFSKTMGADSARRKHSIY